MVSLRVTLCGKCHKLAAQAFASESTGHMYSPSEYAQVPHFGLSAWGSALTIDMCPSCHCHRHQTRVGPQERQAHPNKTHVARERVSREGYSPSQRGPGGHYGTGRRVRYGGTQAQDVCWYLCSCVCFCFGTRAPLALRQLPIKRPGCYNGMLSPDGAMSQTCGAETTAGISSAGIVHAAVDAATSHGRARHFSSASCGYHRRHGCGTSKRGETAEHPGGSPIRKQKEEKKERKSWPHTTGGATPRFWTPTSPPTNCWPETPWGGGGLGLGDPHRLRAGGRIR